MNQPLIILFGLLLFTMLIVYLAKLVIRLKKAERDLTNSQNPDLGFVVNTFQNMVTRLKENEDELKRLRVMAEERAEEIENYTEDVLRSVTSGVITFNLEKKVVTFNRAAEDLLGIHASDTTGTSCGMLFSGARRVCQMLDDVMSDPGPCRRTEVSFRKQAGDDIWIGLTVSALRNRAGNLIGTILVFTDLTEIKLLKEQVELREKMTVLGEMSAGIAHELRNPMGVISGYVELLSKRLKKESQNQEIIQGIIEEINGMNRIITEFLAFARPTDINASAVSLPELLGSIIQSFSKRFEDSGITVKTDFSASAPVIMADDLLLRQAFQNLVQNAIEAIPDRGGEIVLTVRTAKPFLEIGIKDNGIGIPKEKIGKIYTPFFTTKERGTGLGLALVQKIIVYHGGKIEVDSQPGIGTTFSVFLPLHPEKKGGEG